MNETIPKQAQTADTFPEALRVPPKDPTTARLQIWLMCQTVGHPEEVSRAHRLQEALEMARPQPANELEELKRRVAELEEALEYLGGLLGG